MGESSAIHPTRVNWLFVDMNSFFASVEQHLRPELRGLAVGVIPVESEGTCVIAASYEAKAHGVRTGTGVREARRLCPGIRLVRARPAVYVEVHHAVARSVERCAPLHKAYSIDEWSIRLGAGQRDAASAAALGRDIKRCMLEDFGPAIRCSVGVAPTRLLAKIASDLRKPDGLTTLRVCDLPEAFAGVAVGDLCGIGRSMSARLAQRGIRTAGALWRLSKRECVEVWGSVEGSRWWSGFHGADEPEITTRRRSMGHANVLDPRFRNDEGARGVLMRLVDRLGIRLRSAGFLAGGIGIDVVYQEGGSFTDRVGLSQVQDTRSLMEAFRTMWARREGTGRTPFRVGATVDDLVLKAATAEMLFESASRDSRLSHAMDQITRRWGLSSVYYGGMHGYRHAMEEKIAFGRIPSAMD